jgi:class 3 adenylate cyclase/tetratricopeptide (TPR) repeat protein
LLCPACQIPNPPTNKFCHQCGDPLTGAPPAEKFASPQAYTPKHLAEKILTSKGALEGERKQVTVLFADLKGSMELLADRDPEEARKILDPVLERMMEAVHRYEGTVNQVMGDGIMALFGAPLAHEDHAVRACYAALAMQEAIRRGSEELRRVQGLEVQIRVGLHSGEVVVRAIGSDLHMDYTAVGQTTHLAARMEQLAPPGSIRLTAEALRLAEGFIQVAPLGPIPVKGLADPVDVFELLGAAPTRTRLQAGAARGLTRFVGRQTELEALRQALEKAHASHGQIVALVGEAGVGKSRLVWEVTNSHRTEGWLILESGSVSYGKATSYLPVIDLLKAYCQIESRDDPRKIREKMTGKLLTLDRALEPTLPAFLSLLDVPVEDPQWQALDPPQRRQRTLDACKRLLLRESQVQPLLLVFEDLHWIDTETQALLDTLLESLPTARLLLLVNYRPEYQHGWGSKTYYTQLRIDPLPAESADALLQALLGNDAGLGPLKQLLIARTQGNPFFLEESVRTLIETKVLAGERGAYRLATALPSIQVPATVQAVLAARIDRLPAEEKRLLQAAAMIGEEVSFALLQVIADLPEEALRRGLAHLQAAEFLYEASLFPDLAYTFKHGLTYQVAYGSLLQERRRTLHARIVDAIERLYSDRLTEHVERLAHHAPRGEVWEKAVSYLRQAGAKALARSANREAVACFEQALVALSHLPETPETLEQAIDLRFDLRASLFSLRELHKGFTYLREAERLARAINDQRRLARLSVYTSHHFLVTGDAKEARSFGQSAHAIAEALGDLPLQVAANLYVGATCVPLGEFRQAEEHLGRTLRLLAGGLSRERFGLHGFPAAICGSYLAWVLAERGEFDEAIARGREAVQIAEAVDHAYSLVYASWGLAFAHVLRGELAPAARLLERAIALCRDWTLPIVQPLVVGLSGLVSARTGGLAEGLSSLHEAVRSWEKNVGMGIWNTLHVLWLGEVYVLADRYTDALEAAQRGLALTRQFNHSAYEGWALRLLAEIASNADVPDLKTAEGHYRQASALAQELGMRPLLAHCHLGLGKLYRRTGDRAKAGEHLTAAATMYREMDMRFWLAQAEAEMAGVR